MPLRHRPGEPDQVTLPNCDTLVQYMDNREAMVTARKLLERGHRGDAPVVVGNCSLANEHVLRLRLDELELGLTNCSGPVLVIIGAALAAQ